MQCRKAHEGSNNPSMFRDDDAMSVVVYLYPFLIIVLVLVHYMGAALSPKVIESSSIGRDLFKISQHAPVSGCWRKLYRFCILRCKIC